MSPAPLEASSARVHVDGKFFRVAGQKLYLKGVTYGPFAPNERGDTFAAHEQTARDFLQLRELGANLLRVYYVPPRWFLDLAAEHGIKVIVDVPWPKHLCFLDSEELQEEARQTVRNAVESCKGHPALFAFSVVNEIPADIVRWSGVRKVEAFIDELVDEAKAVDADCLCTFTNYPPTEFLRPRNIDFVCFNVYLHQPKSFEGYLARLQMLADNKPLVLGEFGMDSIREGEAHQSEFLSWQIELAFRGGLAGTIIFSFTDDWFRGGLQIQDWAFGLTTRDRQPKESFNAVQRQYRAASPFPLPGAPKVSVVVASYNGARTLKPSLESLSRLNYPDYEVILVDDGSTDNTQEIAKQFPNVHTIRQDNHGLSVARNTGIAAATGQIVAFTDSDCRADQDWLHYLVSDLLNSDFAGIGGHNFLPADDSCVAAAVMASPGGPAHVMLTDREAEHIPGCNMAFYKWALDETGGFDPIFRKAGDDVDICWRLQQCGHKIGFSSAGFVWHYRRSTVKAYLTQQSGYGEAEALLAHKHPEYFNSLGNGIWRGRIYTASKAGVVLQHSVIYHGTFGSGFFQKLYSPGPVMPLMLCTSLEYHALVVLPMVVLSFALPLVWPVAVASLLVPLTVCATAALQAELPKRKRRLWSRPLIALLFLLQPIERGLARYRWRWTIRSQPRTASPPDSAFASDHWEASEKISYWSKDGLDRYDFLHTLLARLNADGWQHKTDTGWNDHDVEIFGNRWSRLRLTTVVEDLHQGKRNLHCRLGAVWSLRAKLMFWALFGVEIVGIGFFAPRQPWSWLLLLTLAIVHFFLEHERRNMEHSIATSLDGAARQHHLIKLAGRPSKPTRSSTRQPPSDKDLKHGLAVHPAQ